MTKSGEFVTWFSRQTPPEPAAYWQVTDLPGKRVVVPFGEMREPPSGPAQSVLLWPRQGGGDGHSEHLKDNHHSLRDAGSRPELFSCSPTV